MLRINSAKGIDSSALLSRPASKIEEMLKQVEQPTSEGITTPATINEKVSTPTIKKERLTRTVSIPMSAIVENERLNSCTTAQEDSCKFQREEETGEHLRSDDADTPSKNDEKHFTHVEELYD